MYKWTEMYLLIHDLNPDIIAINEIWLSTTQVFSIPGFRYTRKDRNGHGGVWLSVKNNWSAVQEIIIGPLEFISVRIQLSDNSKVLVQYIFRLINPDVRIIQYANDVAIYSIGSDGIIMQQNIQTMRNNLSMEYKHIGLSISSAKSQYMVFRQKYKLQTFIFNSTTP